MSAHVTEALTPLEQLQAVSLKMLASAELGDWEAVGYTDKKRLEILQKLQDNKDEEKNSPSRKQLTGEILTIDTKIKELACNERRSLMDEELRYQAQIAAQASYKQALTSDNDHF